MERKCENCNYFERTHPEAIPTLKWEGEIQHIEVTEPEYEGKCTHESNWRPSRGDMPCDCDYQCRYFEVKESEVHHET